MWRDDGTGVWRDDVGHLGRQRRYTHQGVHVDYVLQATAHIEQEGRTHSVNSECMLMMYCRQLQYQEHHSAGDG
jgi:hypothetical protein